MMSVTLKYFTQKEKEKNEANMAKCQQSLNLNDEFTDIHNKYQSIFVHAGKFS